MSSNNFNDDVPIEFLTKDLPVTIAELKCDPELNLLDNEAESWTQSIPKEVLRSIKDKNAIKRQEQIFEFILNEKRNYLILLIMKNMFSEGLERYFHFEQSTLDRLFPRLNDLIAVHSNFLKKLRKRQSENIFVDTIADILTFDFFGMNGSHLKTIYGDFCTQHKDAVDLYKYYSKPNSDFKRFEEFCKNSPLLKKRGIYECILHVSLILTKYPLLIQPMIDTSRDSSEILSLQDSLRLSQRIVAHVDNTMARKQREERKLELYEKLDEKSFATYRGYKFRRCDLLNSKRSLIFEGNAYLVQSNRSKLITVLVFTDVLIFLYENSSQKYVFFKPDNCSSVIPLQKVLIRKKASCKDKDVNTIFLVISNPTEPRMIELHVESPKELDVWDNSIRLAVIDCPFEDDFFPVTNDDKAFLLKKSEIANLIDNLRQKDLDQALLLEDKMSIQLRLLAASGLEPPELTSYRELVNENQDIAAINEIILSTIDEMSQLTSSLYSTGTNLSRSASSVGERQSNTYLSPALPKRSETFGGYDNNPENTIKMLTKKFQSGFSNFADNVNEIFDNNITMDSNNKNVQNISTSDDTNMNKKSTTNLDLLEMNQLHQKVAVQLSHYVYTFLCIITQLVTNNERLKAEINLLKSSNAHNNSESRNHYRHNQQLEELRSLQDKFTADKVAWQKQHEQKEVELMLKEQEFIREKEAFLEHIKHREEDLAQQREQLFRRLERLNNPSLLLSPSSTLSSLSSSSSSSTTITDDKRNKFHQLNNNSNILDANITSGATNNTSSKLPMNLLSAANQQKVQKLPVKQQLPLKLATD